MNHQSKTFKQRNRYAHERNDNTHRPKYAGRRPQMPPIVEAIMQPMIAPMAITT